MLVKFLLSLMIKNNRMYSLCQRYFLEEKYYVNVTELLESIGSERYRA